jgi:4-amino-4-deoxy-L-arabinose transferase-like glycosyltransferase
LTQLTTNEKTNSKYAIWLICLTIGVIWFISFMVFRSAPEWDNMEELVWANSFEWGYQKHPPFPVWIIYPFTIIFGKAMWLPFALGVACVALTQIIAYFLYKRMASNAGILKPHDFGVVGVLVSSALIYYTIRGGDFNHNEAQLWLIAAMFYFYYVSWEKERGINSQANSFWRSWFFFGLATGFAFISKYSVVIQVTVLVAHFLWSGRWRQSSNWLGALLAVFGFLLISSPHLWWLYHQTLLGQGPLFYVGHSISQQVSYFQNILGLVTGFLLTQIFRILICLVVVWMIYRLSKSGKNEKMRATNTQSWWLQLGTSDRTYLLFAALGPTLATMLIGGLTHQKIEAKWAVTFFIYIGFVGFIYANNSLNTKLLIKRVIWGHVLFALIYGLVTGPIALRFGYYGRSNFPSHQLAKVIHQRWEEHPELTQGKSIGLIAGDTWIIGNLIIHEHKNDSRKIKPWIDASDLLSPWITESDKQQTTLIMIDHAPKAIGEGYFAGHPASAKVQELFDKAPAKGVESISWSDQPNSQKVYVQWAILPYPYP